MVAKGELVTVFAGIAVLAGRENDLATRALAAMCRDPDAVITGTAGAALTWWPELARPGMEIEVTCRAKHVTTTGFRWIRWSIPSDMVLQRGPLRFTTPAFSAMDLTATLGGRAIDEALRRGVAILSDLQDAFHAMRHRQHNRERAVLLADSRDCPWSEPERLAHRLLRNARIHGWRANERVVLGGTVMFLDIAFTSLKLAVEIDGPSYHSSREAVERDRRRDLILTLAGWKVVRFSASMVAEDSWIESVHRVIAIRNRELGRVSSSTLGGATRSIDLNHVRKPGIP